VKSAIISNIDQIRHQLGTTVLKSLKTLFNKQGKANKEPSDQDLKLAAATLMFEVVRSDGRIDQVELIIWVKRV